jgi:hypothetical protein
VQIDPGVNLEELSRVAHSLGEVVGLGLRNMANCPVELNLMPESTLRWQSFNQKKPYFIATLASLALMALAAGFLFNKLATVKKDQLEKIQPTISQLQGKEQNFKRAYGDLKKIEGNADQYSQWLEERYMWADILREIRAALIRAEDATKREFGTDTGVWIVSLNSYSTTGSTAAPAAGAASTPISNPEMDAAFRARYGAPAGGRRMSEEEGMRPNYGANSGVPAAVAADGSAVTNAVGTIKVQFSGVSLKQISSANSKIAYAVHAELIASHLIDAAGTQLDPSIAEDDAAGTFSFGITLALKKPLKN